MFLDWSPIHIANVIGQRIVEFLFWGGIQFGLVARSSVRGSKILMATMLDYSHGKVLTRIDKCNTPGLQETIEDASYPITYFGWL
jgi:hypothetical protein